jgi:nitrite reductase (NADH) large subunit
MADKKRAKKRLVMIGNGMAGVRAIEEVLDINPELFDITIFGADKHPNYNRILLSSILSGEKTIEDITLNTTDWYKDNNITLYLNKEITEIQRGYRKVVAADGTTVAYDTLIIATGSKPFILPLPGIDKKGVLSFRDLGDCAQMIEASKTYKKASVIGGGLLGLEAARGLMDLGMDVTVIHDQPTLMNMQLDKVAASMLQKELETQGMQFKTATLTKEILGNGHVTGLSFKDDSEIATDLVIMAVGIRANTDLAKKAHLLCQRGIVVNDYMQTYTDPSIYVVGECAQHRERVYGLVAPLFEQARILAYHITGQGLRTYDGSEVSAKLKVSGIDVFSAGEFQTPEKTEDSPEDSRDTIEYIDQAGGIYKKLILDGNRLAGVVLYGDTSDGVRLFQMIQANTDISAQRGTLILGNPNLGDAGHSGISQVANMLPETIVCGCNGITKKTIEDAITKEGLTTRQEVTGCTKAAGSCGGCEPLIDQILASVLGSSFAKAAGKTPLCGCTEFTHDDVKASIRNNSLTSVAATMATLEWKGEGCRVCRPALNYYVQTAFPETARDEPASRHVNERLHANIQKDGTFSVVPRIYGGLTSPEELARIAKVARKYKVPAIKFTGGQRIDLLGVAKENLPALWKALKTPSGFAYAKALRTVKTCVGNKWCRFGTQDSMGFGIELEKELEGIWTPAKLKLAVSGCPRNCAEASTKDIGIVGVEGGWEVYCGGNGGIRLRGAELLCTSDTTEEATIIIKAYVQLYRTDARYGERTSTWIERVGLNTIKEKVVNDVESRAALATRLDEYTSTIGDDPWKTLASTSKANASEANLRFKSFNIEEEKTNNEMA